MNNNYYIFLDIDGTLWDLSINPYLIRTPQKLKKESIDAVNNLIDGLKNKGFKPHLVITSGMRSHWNTCSETLFVNGINPKIPMQPLFVNKRFSRGEKIAIFLHDKHNGKKHPQQREVTFSDHFKTNFAKKVNNYVVIDDSLDKLSNIPNHHIIKTNLYTGALNNEMVINYLENISPYIDESEYEL